MTSLPGQHSPRCAILSQYTRELVGEIPHDVAQMIEGFVVYESPFMVEGFQNLKGHVCVFAPDCYTDALFPVHGITCPRAVRRAVEKRKMDYVAGRYCAKAVLKAHGAASQNVGTGAGRSPMFPVPFIGSISHTRDMACCVAMRRGDAKGLGVDVEEILLEGRVDAVWASIVGREEEDLFAQIDWPRAPFVTMVFSAKESLFKAIYPTLGRYFGFECATVRHIDCDRGLLVFELTKTLSDMFFRGMRLETRYYFLKNKVLTLTVL